MSRIVCHASEKAEKHFRKAFLKEGSTVFKQVLNEGAKQNFRKKSVFRGK